ncbi:MAG: squalene synthase HpnC [Dehalococcoidia bacterium]|jgi:squalene synthase HpnC|nr:squalene synthase HpnC [Dehalococcoidia bacterium]
MASRVEGLRQEVASAFAYCREVALGHYENFTVVSWLLPRRLRPHMYAIYAYCRGVDDLGDEAEGDRLALLDAWEEELWRAYEGRARHPVFVALQETIAQFSIPPEPFLKLIEANRMDQLRHRYGTYQELLHYCEHSANPVGHLVLYLFGYRDEERRRLADATCTGLQLANFWQDVSVDLRKGRIYIPQEDMRAFGYSEEELLAGVCDERFRRLMAMEVERARRLLREGMKLAAMVRGRLRLDVKLFNLGGLAILDAIEAIGYDVLHHRPTLSKARKAMLAVRGLMPF